MAGTTSAESTREQARAAKRDEILAAARRVFARQGFRGTTIADIAEEAKIALGTIYLYFPSKEDVFAALNQELHQIIGRALTGVGPAGSVDEAVRTRINNVFEGCAENRDLIRLVFLNTDADSAATQRMRTADENRAAPLVDAIRAGIEQSAVRQGDPVIMTRLTIGAVTMSVYQAFVLDDGRSWEKYRDACADMIVAYFTPQARQQAANEASRAEASTHVTQ